jgi:hypothetical protein
MENPLTNPLLFPLLSPSPEEIVDMIDIDSIDVLFDVNYLTSICGVQCNLSSFFWKFPKPYYEKGSWYSVLSDVGMSPILFLSN